MNLEKYNASEFKGKIAEMGRLGENLRKGSIDDCPQDIDFDQLINAKFGITRETLFDSLGIDLAEDTISNIMTLPDPDVRWLVPEFIREAIVLGYRGAPIWSNITAIDETIKGLTTILPSLNMSDAGPKRVNEGETIPLGDISYGSRHYSMFKMGRGISIPDEVVNYVKLNVIGLFLNDYGIKFGHAMDTLAINTLLNGEQADGSMAAPIIGIGNTSAKVYADFLRIWVRATRLGRNFNTIIGGEAAAVLTLNLDEFKKPVLGAPQYLLNLKTPVPRDASYYMHGLVPAGKEILLDTTKALIKLTAMPLMIESERIVNSQKIAFYATTTTGFAKLFKDGSVVMDAGHTYDATAGNAYGFPTYFNVDDLQNVPID